MLELVGGVRILLELVLGSALTGCVLAIDLVLEQEGVDIVICERGTNMSAYASHAASRSRPQQQGSQSQSQALPAANCQAKARPSYREKAVKWRWILRPPVRGAGFRLFEF